MQIKWVASFCRDLANTHCNRPVCYMTCVCRLRNYTYLSRTLMKFSIWPGHRIMRPSLAQLPAIGGSTFGIYRLSVRSKRQMIRKTALQSSCLYTAVCPDIYLTCAALKCRSAIAGHTARPTDFCWAPHELDNWTATSISEDNVLMIWQPTMRVWA